jgi:glycosyltransferase involved in cell wall biosynthesis
MQGVPSFDRAPGQAADICLIAEGCYPHITGGVASWLDWLMRNLPQYTFAVVSIVSGDEPRESKYSFPHNLVSFRELNLKGLQPPRLSRRYVAKPAAVEAFADILDRLLREGSLQTLAELLDAIEGLPRSPTYHDLTRSEFAWELVTAVYQRQMPQSSFLDFFWAWQALVGGLFATILFPLPKASIYHAISTGYAGLLAARASIETGKRTLLTEHGIYTNERRIEILTADWISDTIDTGLALNSEKTDLRSLWITSFESYARACYESCETITTLYSDNQKLQLDLGADSTKLKVIPNGIDVAKFVSCVPERGNPPTIALVGRVVPIKDIKTFVAAVDLVRQLVPDLRALVLGPLDEDREYANECEQMIAELNLEETITLTGRVNVLDWLPKVQVMVLSSLSEAQPLTLLEAGAAGIPCVTTNVGSCREILLGTVNEDPPCGDGGFVTDVVSPDQIAAAVTTLLRDKQLREEMGANLRERVSRFYSSERSRDAYDDLYRGVDFEESARWPA